MTLEEFYSKYNVFEKLVNYIGSYDNNDVAMKIAKADDVIDELRKKISKSTYHIIFKHFLLVIFIPLFIALPFLLISGKVCLNIFSTLLLVTITFTVFLVRLLRDSAKTNSRYSNFAEDIDTANIDGIKKNHQMVNKIVSDNNEVLQTCSNDIIFKFINNYYFHGKYDEFNKTFDEYNFLADIWGTKAILLNMISDIESTCKNLYKSLTNPDDENEFSEKIFKKFDDSFLRSVYEKTTFCNDPKLNKFMMLWVCYSYMRDIFKDDNNQVFISFNHYESFDEIKNDYKPDESIEQRLNYYGVAGLQVVVSIIVDYGLKLIERDCAIMEA